MPPSYDVWISNLFASELGRHPLFDRAVQSLVYHNVLGGLWFALALFFAWIEVEKGDVSEDMRVLVWTIFLSSMLVAILSVLASSIFHWVPPNRNPILSSLYPDYIDRNENTSSFPSQSTAVYAALAAGFYSWRPKVGLACWVAVGAMVALPRMYVGGHYLTDVMAGVILGVGGYIIGRRLFAPLIGSHLQAARRSMRSFQMFADVVAFLWILQLAVEFRDLVWLRRVLEHYMNR